MTTVRIWSPAGPCLTDTVIKTNRVTVQTRSYGKVERFRIHTEPCNRCTDHPTTSFKNGYND
jgi:hypothetical protein